MYWFFTAAILFLSALLSFIALFLFVLISRQLLLGVEGMFVHQLEDRDFLIFLFSPLHWVSGYKNLVLLLQILHEVSILFVAFCPFGKSLGLQTLELCRARNL